VAGGRGRQVKGKPKALAAVGRYACRPRVVIPVFIDTEEDATIALDDSAFKPVWDVIKALRSHDDELGEQLDELRRQLGRLRQRQRPRLPDKIHLDLPAKVGIDFAHAFKVRLVEQTTASWEFSFGVLEQFAERNGDARVPQSYSVDGYPLGWWVTTERSFYRRGTLDAERQHRLQDLTGWTWDPVADQWEEGFRLHAKGILGADRQRRLKSVDGWTWKVRSSS
jgi:hypothetical protein